MKKLILSLIMIAMLTGCVSKPVKQEEVGATVEEIVTTAETTVSETEKTIAVSNYDTEYSPVKNYSDLTFRSTKGSKVDNDVITYIEPQEEPIFSGINIGDDISSLKDYDYYDEKNKSYIYYEDSAYIVFGEDKVEAISIIEKHNPDEIYDGILNDALNLKNKDISLDDFISKYPLYSSYTADKGDVSIIYPNGIEICVFSDEVKLFTFNNPYTEWDISEIPDVIDTKENYDAKELYDFMEIMNSSDWISSPDGEYSALSYDDCAYYNARIIIRDGKEIKAVNTGHFASDLFWEDNKLYFEVYTGESCFYDIETDMICKLTDKHEIGPTEKKLIDLSEKKISEYNEEDFSFLLNTDFSIYINAFDTTGNLGWGKINGSNFSYFFLPMDFSAPIGIYTGITYSGYDVKSQELSGTPEMLIIDFDTDLISENETVSGKFRKGMSIEDVKKVADTEEYVFTDERLSKDYTYYKTYGENLEYGLWFSENGELSEIQIVAVKQDEKENLSIDYKK